MVELSSSFETLLSVISGQDNREARVALASLSGTLKETFNHSYTANIAHLNLDRAEIEGEVALLLAIRTLWSLVPRRLFLAIDPNYEALAQRSWEAAFGKPTSTKNIA